TAQGEVRVGHRYYGGTPQSAVSKSATSRKWRSRVTRTIPWCFAMAAIQISFSGSGRPFSLRSCFRRPYSQATPRSHETMALPVANSSTVAMFSDGRPDFAAPKQLAERHRRNEYLGRLVQIGQHRVITLQQSNDDVGVQQEPTTRWHQPART